MEKDTKTSPKGVASTFDSVTDDLVPITIVLLLAMVVIGSDVSRYVSEVHILRKV